MKKTTIIITILSLLTVTFAALFFNAYTKQQTYKTYQDEVLVEIKGQLFGLAINSQQIAAQINNLNKKFGTMNRSERLAELYELYRYSTLATQLAGSSSIMEAHGFDKLSDGLYVRLNGLNQMTINKINNRDDVSEELAQLAAYQEQLIAASEFYEVLLNTFYMEQDMGYGTLDPALLLEKDLSALPADLQSYVNEFYNTIEKD